jgi:Lipocalin-like domain
MPDFDTRIVGTWRLVITRAYNDAGEPMAPPYGPQPMGVVVFSPDRRMICVLCDSRASLPPGETEREYNSYCGACTFDGATLVTRVDACSDPARMGSDQVRRVRFEGERLVLMPPPRPWRGQTQHRELFWEKVG